MSELISPNAPNSGFAAISKYNPHLWSAEQLRAIFVARQNELAELLCGLRDKAINPVSQHVLLVGARGMGKSTLMRRLALAVEDDPELNAAWLALRFPEEQYTVDSLGQFWANVLDSLADTLEQQGQPTRELDTKAQRIPTLPLAEQEAAYLAAINQCAEERQQRLLLLVDNSDLLLHNIGDKAQWGLRNVLQNNPNLFWVGGSYQTIEADSGYHDAFLDFFDYLYLRPLSLEEMADALQALAQTFGDPGAQQLIAQQLTRHPERLSTLRQLSGGNPRTTVMLYELFSQVQPSNVRNDLEALLDNMTPVYKARMDALADLPRKLLAHILEHWAPISLGQLAEVSQVANTSISPQLKRLQQEGLIEKTPLHGTSRSGYQVSERFFNIWYLMRLSPRRQRTRLNWLVEFMRLWFRPEDLRDLARARLGTSHNSLYELEYDRALADALPPNVPERHALRWGLLKHSKVLTELLDLSGEDSDFLGAANYLERLEPLPDLLGQCPHAQNEAEKAAWVEAVMGSISLNLEQKEKLAAKDLTLQKYQQLQDEFATETQHFERLSSPEAVKVIRQALLQKNFFPDFPDSPLAYQQIQSCFAEHPGALCLASILFSEEHQNESALQALALAQKACPQNVKIISRRAALLANLQRYSEAEAAYRNAIALDEDNPDPWNNLGNLLTKQQRFTEAEAAYRQAMALENYAAWNGLGNLLKEQQRYSEAEAVYRHAIALENLAAPWNGLGNLLTKQQRFTEAETAYRNAIALDEDNPLFRNNLGNLLAIQQRFTEAEAAYRQAIALDKNFAAPCNGLGNLLTNQQRFTEAEAAYHQAIALDKNDAVPWNSLGNLLTNQQRFTEAEAAYRKAIALDKNYAPWNSLGNLLRNQQRFTEAEAAYRNAIALGDIYAKINLAQMLWQGQRQEALDLYRQLAQANTKPLTYMEQADQQAMLLQAHLCLENRQLAEEALENLCQAIQQGEASAFNCLKRAVWIAHALGLAERLGDWMRESRQALFLQLFTQALYTLAGAEQKLQDLPQEVQQMVDAIVQAVP